MAPVWSLLISVAAVLRHPVRLDPNHGPLVGAASGLHGFLFSGGTYTTLDDPLGTNGTIATGINNTGQIVGTYQDAGGASQLVELVKYLVAKESGSTRTAAAKRAN